VSRSFGICLSFGDRSPFWFCWTSVGTWLEVAVTLFNVWMLNFSLLFFLLLFWWRDTAFGPRYHSQWINDYMLYIPPLSAVVMFWLFCDLHCGERGPVYFDFEPHRNRRRPAILKNGMSVSAPFVMYTCPPSICLFDFDWLMLPRPWLLVCDWGHRVYTVVLRVK